MANDRLDIAIFGATGYTGKYVVKNAVHMCKERKMKFGIAGRRKEALEAVVKEFAADIEDVPIILADIKDEESLEKMTERAKILINCCGPYRFYGEPVVKACIATRTHYIDVAGEEQFMLEMQLKYNKAAKEAGIYVVNACGFECISSDLGIIFTQQKFEGDVNTIEVYLNCFIPFNKKGPMCNYGSWESMIHFLSHGINEAHELRKKLYPSKLPEFTPKLKSSLLHRSDVSEGWSIPFPSADRSVTLRTQRFLYDQYKERPAQIQVYITFKSFFEFLIVAIAGLLVLGLSCITCGRNLLLKYPALFTLGFISHEKPNLEMLTSSHFSMTFKASGWTEKLAEPTDKHTDPPNKKVITKVSGVSPAYEITSIAAILSAITILNETDKIPDNGGVLTAGAAFGKTSLIEQLIKHNIKFEVISSSEKSSSLQSRSARPKNRLRRGSSTRPSLVARGAGLSPHNRDSSILFCTCGSCVRHARLSPTRSLLDCHQDERSFFVERRAALQTTVRLSQTAQYIPETSKSLESEQCQELND